VIAVDTSALVAIVLKEPQADACLAALGADDEVLMSAGTLAEVFIVSTRRNVGTEMARLIERLAPDVVPVTSAVARRIGEAYSRWGRGVHPAALNLGDCFVYAIAQEHACGLLYVGDDFAKTDIEAVL
jgi:ribonuclease VapC